jgi:TolB-like protein/tetratricopeptide (TPR) repeat protein
MAAAVIDPGRIREHLSTLLASRTFSSAQRHRRFLEFVVEQTLAGNQPTIKESVIGSEVFGREAGYDPRADGIVRVEANKLRTRLAAYYEGPGKDDDIVIEIPKGSYVPRFSMREPVANRAPGKATAGRRQVWAAIAIVAAASLTGAALWFSTVREGGRSATDMPSVAVLPFLNLSGDPENQYFSDGLAEQLTDALAQVKGLRVASRTSAFAFRGKAADAQEIGKRLGVGAFIEGSVRKEDHRVRVTAQLVQTSDGYHLWSQTFERELRDVFAIQDEISQAVARRLRVNLSAVDRNRLTRRPTDNLEAFDLYLRGLYIIGTFPSPAMANEATALFEEALRKDPEFGLAYNGIARVKVARWISEDPGATELVEPIMSATRRAIEIDPGLAEAYSTLGTMQARHDWKWAEAEKTFRHAIELSPGSPDAHWRYAQDVLLPLRRFDEAIAENRRAIEIDPFTLAYATGLAWILDYSGRSDEAVAEYRRVLARWPGNPPVQAALTGLEAALSKDDRLRSELLPLFALAYDRAGRRADAQRVKRELAGAQARSRASALQRAIALGHLDEARAVASVMIRERSANVYYLAIDPMFRPLKDDPTFAALLRQTGLPLD